MSGNKARGPMMGGHRSRAMNSGEKAKDFKGAMKLLKYMERIQIPVSFSCFCLQLQEPFLTLWTKDPWKGNNRAFLTVC